MSQTVPRPLETSRVQRLDVRVYRDRDDLGTAAGCDVGTKLQDLLAHQASVRMAFAAAPSQEEFLGTLSRIEGIGLVLCHGFPAR